MTLGLAKAGIAVTVAELPSSQAEIGELVALARTQGLADKVHAIDCDVTRWEDCRAAVEKAAARFGAVHGLVNNAGLGMQHIGHVVVGTRKKFHEVDAYTWRKSIDVNLNGPFMMAKAIAPVLVAQGWGRIVNIQTSNFTMVMEGFSPYGPSKAALEAATVIWAKDLAGTGVTVNALAPGGPANTHDPGGRGRRPLDPDPARGHGGADRLADVAALGRRHRPPHHCQGVGRRAAGERAAGAGRRACRLVTGGGRWTRASCVTRA
jgi:NAD(P)-dependent dehydrogenase (short-subunit alcohol dehydrogenase family)